MICRSPADHEWLVGNQQRLAAYWKATPCAASAASGAKSQVTNSVLVSYTRARLNEAKKKKDTRQRNLLVSAVELHDPLLYLLLIWQEFVHSQKVPVC